MKLFYSPTSPFVRKVLVVAIERGLRDRLELVAVQVSPLEKASPVVRHNPAGKIPTLLLEDGSTLCDSRVIVEYLDALPGGPSLLPVEPARRWRALTLQSRADALTDAAVLLRYETSLRPEGLRWPAFIEGQWAKVDATLDELERGWLAHLEAHLDVGAIAVACALGYLDFRFADRAWRATRPGLAAWLARFAERPSLVATRPPA